MPIYDLSKPLEMVLYTFFESIGYERPKFRSIDAAASLKGMGTIQLPSYTN